jgi:hypothetical protein
MKKTLREQAEQQAEAAAARIAREDAFRDSLDVRGEQPGVEVSEALPWAAQGADALTTAVVKHQGGTEANPAMRGIANNPWTLFATKLAVGFGMNRAVDYFNDRGHRKAARWLSAGLTILGAGPALHNATQIRRK